MKKLLLLLAAGSFAASANAQEATHSIVAVNGTTQKTQPMTVAAGSAINKALNTQSTSSAARTTSLGGSRWYNYGGYQYNIALGGDYTTGGSGAVTAPYMWNDTSAQNIYSGTPPLGFNHLVSVAQVLDPSFTGFNDVASFTGLIGVSPSTAYTIDSIGIEGVYGRRTNDITTVDTLRVYYTADNASSTDNLGVSGWEDGLHSDFPYTIYATDTLLYISVFHDSTTNHMIAQPGSTSGAGVYNFDILLHYTDTVNGGNYANNFQLASPLAVAAGALPAMSLTFISGDPTAPKIGQALNYGDTVFTGSTTSPNLYRYGMFRPTVVYNSDATGNPVFMHYGPAGSPYLLASDFKEINDLNVGEYKTEVSASWGGQYIPMWAYGSPTQASTYQYPAWGSWHIVCPTCPTTESLNAPAVANNKATNVYPNPTTNTVNVTYAGTATVTLTNMVGQVVATQNNVSSKATFNTAALANGVYIYTVDNNGQRTTGRVVVAH